MWCTRNNYSGDEGKTSNTSEIWGHQNPKHQPWLLIPPGKLNKFRHVLGMPCTSHRALSHCAWMVLWQNAVITQSLRPRPAGVPPVGLPGQASQSTQAWPQTHEGTHDSTVRGTGLVSQQNWTGSSTCEVPTELRDLLPECMDDAFTELHNYILSIHQKNWYNLSVTLIIFFFQSVTLVATT